MKFHNIQLQEGSTFANLVLVARTSFPAGPDEGELVFRSDADPNIRGLYLYMGSVWTRIGSPADSDGEYLSLTGGTLSGTLNATDILPTETDMFDLGNSGKAWKDLTTGTVNTATINVGEGAATSEIIRVGSLFVEKAGSLITTSTTKIAVDSFGVAQYSGAKYMLHALDAATGDFYMTELLVSKDASNSAYVGEYSTVCSGGTIVNYTAEYDLAGSLHLYVTPSSNNYTTIKFQATLFIS